jgi:hypothetical protein
MALVLLTSCTRPVRPTPSRIAPATSINREIRSAVDSMPSGGGYDSSPEAVDRLAASVTLRANVIHQDLSVAGPTFCSGATYLVFLRTLERLGLFSRLSPESLARLARLDVRDGEEVFGRWNANGPGTAKLFADLDCGVNFTDFRHARPGDFLKIWWTTAIGRRERGHSVIFLSQSPRSITFWSANEASGYGRQTVTKARIKHHLFSRFTTPDHLARATELPPIDPFLAAMLHQDFSWEQIRKACRVKATP